MARRTKADKEFEEKVSRIAAAATENNPVSVFDLKKITQAVLEAAAAGKNMKEAAEAAVAQLVKK
jgi:hypothetical protein